MFYGSFDANMILLTKAINDLKWGCKDIQLCIIKLEKAHPK